MLFFFFKCVHLFIWLLRVLVATCRIFVTVYGFLLLWCRVSRPVECGILVPQPRIKPMSPALEGGFLTTGLPGKSKIYALNSNFLCSCCPAAEPNSFLSYKWMSYEKKKQNKTLNIAPKS